MINTRPPPQQFLAKKSVDKTAADWLTNRQIDKQTDQYTDSNVQLEARPFTISSKIWKTLKEKAYKWM